LFGKRLDDDDDPSRYLGLIVGNDWAGVCGIPAGEVMACGVE